MYPFKIIYKKNGEISYIETSLTGQALLSSSKLNKGAAFTQKERELFELTGLLPYQTETLEQQVERMYVQYNEHRTNLGKNIYLNVLHDYNETLFYKLASAHLEEMLPIIYTPTVGEAVQRFSLEHRRAKGLYISYKDKDKIDTILDHRMPPDVDISVVTDGGAVLGIGDQGIGGINISIAKLMVYSLCGGIHPHRTLPIQLDVGTNNASLLNDPMYLGWRHERITGAAYDDFIDAFVTSLTKKFPNIYLHWEDIGRDHARNILDRYRDKICTINGDMQATGSVALACVLAAAKASGTDFVDHRIVILGAGTAGAGIADNIYAALLRAGLSADEARSHIFLVDKDGLLTDKSNLLDFQKPYARSLHEIASWQLADRNRITLLDVVKNMKATILIGCSTATGAFNEDIVKTMAANAVRPIIMPLSNPNSLAEADPHDLIKWTKGQAIIATGSPFPDVEYDHKIYRIAQSNNAFAFPGIGLGICAVKAQRLSDNMLAAGTQALSECSPANQNPFSPLLPRLSHARMVSYNVAVSVAEEARKEGLTEVAHSVDLKKLIASAMWEPKYYPYRKNK